MEIDKDYFIESLLVRRPGRIEGPSSTLDFAHEMMQSLGWRFNRLARLSFRDDTLLRQMDGDGIAEHDCILIAFEKDDILRLTLWLDTGLGGIPVAYAHYPDPNITLAPIYAKQDFAAKLELTDLQEIFQYVCDHREILAILE